MKNLNSAVIAWTRCIVAAVTLLFAATFNFSYSQCSLACNGSTQVSLDINCQATITPEMILNDQSTSCPAGVFEVEVYTEYADIPTSPTITSEYMGQVVIAEVIDINSGNSCWGYLTLEDKLGPIIDSCPTAPIDVACSDLTEYAGPTFVDACEGPVPAILLSEDIIPLSCDATYIKEITRVYTAVDSDGYYAPNCTITYRLLRIDFDNIIYPYHYVQNDLSAPTCGNGNKGALSCDGEWKAGQGTLNPDTDTDNDGILDTDVYWDDNNNEYPDPEEVGVPEMVQVLQPENLSLYPFPDVYCNSVVTFSDYELPQIGCTKKIMRSWIVREWHCNGEVADTCLQIIEILDEEAPSVICNASMTITTNTITGPVNNNTYGDVTCGSTTALALPAASDNCSTLLGYDVDYPGGFVKGYTGQTAIVLPMGTNAVKWTVYDECYNSTVCEQIIEVVDNTPPVA
ncbi:MAG: hypothetical protein KJO50_04130, partial [Bacteroidia bacterium]|nr:hypothetical protein [Bacteroidia bacterium]